MLAVAEALALEGFAAGGSSMGCATAPFAALQAPARIDRLVLVTPPKAWESRRGRGDAMESAAQLVEQEGLHALAELESQGPLPRILANDFPAYAD